MMFFKKTKRQREIEYMQLEIEKLHMQMARMRSEMSISVNPGVPMSWDRKIPALASLATYPYRAEKFSLKELVELMLIKHELQFVNRARINLMKVVRNDKFSLPHKSSLQSSKL